jgi:hypothetical protein
MIPDHRDNHKIDPGDGKLRDRHQEIIKKIILAFGPYNRLMRPREASRGLTWVI